MMRQDLPQRRRTLSRSSAWSFGASVLMLAVGTTAPANAQSCTGVWSQRATTTAPSPRGGAAAALDPVRSRVVLFGGGTTTFGASHMSDTWEWDGASWILRSTIGPSARTGAGMVFDSRRNRIVLHGGWSGPMGTPSTVHHHDTWEWDGTAWSLRSTDGPADLASLYGKAMAYDPDRGRVVLVGGLSGFSFTYVWDGTTWSPAPSLPGGESRAAPSLAYDRTRRRMVLAGGINGDSSPAVSTLEWDGTGPWVVRATTGGPPRGQLAYDERRGRVLAYFGAATPLLEWDGDAAAWVLRATGPGPGSRANSVVTCDPVEHQLMVFGGVFQGIYLADTWNWELEGAPSILQSPTDQSGATIALNVVADGPGPLTYQWQRNGVDLTDIGAISGATTPTLTISPATLADSGLYRVKVSNACATSTSAAALVTACRADWDGNGTISPADIAAFVTTWFGSLSTQTLAGDFDGNGVVEPADISLFVGEWFAALTSGC